MTKLPEFNVGAVAFLVADDDMNMRQVVIDILRSLGVNSVQEVGDGETALARLSTYIPDIILCEWEMPKVSGIELTRQIRRNGNIALRQTPIIFVTAHTRIGHVEDARDAGINEYLAKPISAKTLYSRICSVIERPRPFVEASEFIGPDRRRRHDPYKVVLARRSSDKSENANQGGSVTEDEIDAMLGL